MRTAFEDRASRQKGHETAVYQIVFYQHRSRFYPQRRQRSAIHQHASDWGTAEKQVLCKREDNKIAHPELWFVFVDAIIVRLMENGILLEVFQNSTEVAIVRNIGSTNMPIAISGSIRQNKHVCRPMIESTNLGVIGQKCFPRA